MRLSAAQLRRIIKEVIAEVEMNVTGEGEDMPPPEAQDAAEAMQLCRPDEIEYSRGDRGEWQLSPGLTGEPTHYWDGQVWVEIYLFKRCYEDKTKRAKKYHS